MTNPVLFVRQWKNTSNLKTVPVPIFCVNYRLSRYNTSVITLMYRISKSFGRGLDSYESRTGQPRLIVDNEGTGNIDEVLPSLKRAATLLYHPHYAVPSQCRI